MFAGVERNRNGEADDGPVLPITAIIAIEETKEKEG
jgi:hypothetical protein